MMTLLASVFLGLMIVLAPSAMAMNKADLIESIVVKTGLSPDQAGDALDAFIDNTTKLLEKQRVQLVGFGTFSVRKRRSHAGRNSKAGEKVFISGSRQPIGWARQQHNNMLRVQVRLPHNGLATAERSVRLLFRSPHGTGHDARAFASKALHRHGRTTEIEVLMPDLELMARVFGPPDPREMIVIDAEFPADGGHDPVRWDDGTGNLFNHFLPDFFPETGVNDGGCALRLLGAELGLGRDGFCDANRDATVASAAGDSVGTDCNATAEDFELLAATVAAAAGIPRDQAMAAIDVIVELGAAVPTGRFLGEIAGFGVFSQDNRPARRGINPFTGQPIPIPAKHVVRFKAGTVLAGHVD